MKEQFRVVANGRGFQQAVKFLKKRGGEFDGATKTWAVDAGKLDESDCRVFGLELVRQSSEFAENLPVDFEPEHTLGM